jgi:hypothetical protein
MRSFYTPEHASGVQRRNMSLAAQSRSTQRSHSPGSERLRCCANCETLGLSAHAERVSSFEQGDVKIGRRAELLVPALDMQMPAQATQLQTNTGVPHYKILPHVPDEIGTMVFSQEDLRLDPMVLLTLMNVEGEDHIPPFLTRLAWDDKFWKPYSYTPRENPCASYAQAFVDRWRLKSMEDKALIENLWTAKTVPAKALQAADDARDDFDVVMAAVSQNGLALRYASARLRDERAIVMAAVKQIGLALYHASVALRGDRAIVMAAVSQFSGSLMYASTELQNELHMAVDGT